MNHQLIERHMNLSQTTGFYQQHPKTTQSFVASKEA
jgi:hypothetical protein